MSLPLEFLKVITCDFSTERELGRGAYGVVYKGVLQSGKVIAVKKIFDAHLLDLDNKKNKKQFENEILCLMGVKHQNVVQLVGYCVQTRSEVMKLPSGEHVMVDKHACLLCFEFLFKGSLEKYISDDFLVLDWDMRYEIISGVCRGLHYLHDKCHIVHLDLKPQNILMDAMMMPKIADFGLSRLLGEQKSRTLTSNLAGTPGYMAKEYIDMGIISYKADIFSLGVIIIEIITGRRDYPNIGEGTEISLKHFADEVVGSWRNILEMTPKHMSLEMHIQQVEQCFSIALKCLEPDSKKRPTSLHIVQSITVTEPKCRSLGNSNCVAEKDRRNHNLQSQVNMNIINIPKTISAINSLNECANLFQWVISAISSLKSKWSATQQEKLQGNVQQLHSDLQCLSDTLPAKYNLIDRAEWRIHDHYVAGLLSKLKDAVYDAEDLLDEFRWYEKKVSLRGDVMLVEPIIDFFYSVTRGSFSKVADIQKRLNHLSRPLEKMDLLQVVPRFDKSFRPETTSFPIQPEIFGRDNEKEKLIRMLGVPTNNSTGPSGRKRKRNGVYSSTSNQICATSDGNIEATTMSVQVLPIVGIGGVGKTTLAQDICNNSEVRGHFKLIIWICVSDDFDVKRLTKEAIEQTSGEVLDNGNLNSLQLALAESVEKKKLLVVLDDMWDENELHWKRFCAPFKDALQGSMMVVTTRSPKVAYVVGTMDPFPLEGLKEDVFRKFFKFCVFGPNISNIDPELERIGEKILPKLRGSPLAAKTLGRLLGMSLELAHWDRILKSQLWELQQKETDILPALRLSYMYLPLYLKRCFSFCAVYPKDYIFKMEDLVEIWVAEGLVEHHPNISFHHTGAQYFEELAHLSFFQKYPRDHEKYVIHDLMHDMAQLVSKDECFIVKEKNDLAKIPQNVRHLSVLNGGDVRCSDLLNHDMAQHRKLRTLFCHLSLQSETDNTVMEKWCNEFLCMRVIVCSITKWGLPANISNMKLLRYLQILNSSLCKSLPSAFCCLYNMQIFHAKKWVIDDFPRGFGMLINMQKFESVKYQFPPIHSIGTQVATDQGQETRFVLKNYNGESLPRWFHPQNKEQIVIDVKIADCRNLSNLEQFLQPACVPIIKNIEIFSCRSLESVPTESFGDLRFLEVLRVSHCPKIKSQHLFAPSLKKLYLEDSGNLGCKIDCSSLTILHLSHCPLESIELQMRNLRLLEELKISFCPSLTVIRDSEPISSDILHGEARRRAIDHTFLCLTDVEITDCRNLSSQEQFLQPVHMPIILKIKISNCRSLESVPTKRFGYFCFLEELSVSHCPKIKSQHLFAPSLKKLYLEDSGNLGCKIDCSSLTILHLSHCPLESIELQMRNLRLLEELKISFCPSLTVIRDSEPISSDILHGEARSRAIGNTFSSLTVVQFRNCLCLTDVEITDCRNLSSQEQFLQPVHMPIILKIKISNCRSLESVPTKRFGYFCFLEELSVSHCPKIKSQHLFAPSLKKLYLEDSGNLGCKIDCSSLTILHLSHCPLESIELQMRNLRLLEELKISFCPSLTVIRDSEPISSDILHGEARSRAIGNTFSSLTVVQFRNCQNLSSLEQFLQPGYVHIIKRIEISGCGSLGSVPSERFGDLHFLEVLRVSHCPMIKSHRLFAPSLKMLYLTNSGNLGGNIECSSLTIFHLSNCPLASIELQMWNLPLLQELKISFCSSLTIIRDSEPISSANFRGEARRTAIDSPFSYLTDVVIHGCHNLSSLEQFLQPGYVPIIKQIEIYYCTSLQSVPTDRFGDFCFLEVLCVSHCPMIKSQRLFVPSLKELYLMNSGNLGCTIECSSLTILHFSNYPLESIELQMWNLPLLQELEIRSCSSLAVIRDSEPISTDLFHGGVRSCMGKFPLLTHLTIHFCDKLKNIDDLLNLPAIEQIFILSCGLLSLPTKRLGGFLKVLKISMCGSLDWQSGIMLPPTLQELKLSRCGDFSTWFPSCLENLAFLESLEIRDCECIVSVPGHLWSSNLRSLQRLMFLNCSKLKSIGGPGAVTQIRDLCIDYCPELKEIDLPLRRGSFL